MPDSRKSVENAKWWSASLNIHREAKRGTSFVCISFNTWQKLVNCFVYIKELISFNSAPDRRPCPIKIRTWTRHTIWTQTAGQMPGAFSAIAERPVAHSKETVASHVSPAIQRITSILLLAGVNTIWSSSVYCWHCGKFCMYVYRARVDIFSKWREVWFLLLFP